ncbi:KilA-N domain-containing protein [Vitreoscilla stercoraria]|uniref:KilA-N domain-containing protein n=1 Tax=Vitreoscilla stercoraria TaxID=61 RepID=A0ABY4EBN2_VITST|nr:KilA-N domain-containing protein [Vitreoscilla stercoraria]UOO93160.1 KilA-N domain-containing protein [Vitreoscilla stercoraria]
MAKLIPLEYQGMSIHANSEAWFNATEMAAMFDKRPVDWLKQVDTERYIDTLCKKNEVTKNHFVKTIKGGNTAKQGTWLHRKLAVRFAQWLDMDFAIWCDEQIEAMLTNGQTWQKHRTELSSITILRNRFIEQKRTAEGKATESHHYINEALVVNEALTGKRTAIDRNSLTLEQIAMLDKLEQENVLMLLQNTPYPKRKQHLFDLAAPIRHQMQITSISGVAL